MLCLWNLATFNSSEFSLSRFNVGCIHQSSLPNFWTVAMVLKKTGSKGPNSRDNYNSLTLAKLPFKNGDGHAVKIYLCGQKRQQNKHTNWKIIYVIRTMAALEMMITIHPRIAVKEKVAEGTWKGLWNNDLVTLCGWENARTLHSNLYCAVCHNMNSDGLRGMKHFICAWITGSDNQKASNVMDHAILSIAIANSFINDYMWLLWTL